MCAIIGVVSHTPIKDSQWLVRGRDLMKHRGPDDKGVWCSDDKRVNLAHRRLSIIDTSSDAHQPMTNLREDLAVVFNGEIYNYRALRKILSNDGFSFFSSSDTEVLLAAWVKWGVECVNYLEGMFAFAINDSKKNTVFCARDRVGEKPFFYTYNDGEFRFSSELKGFFCDPNFDRSMNKDALNHYLERGFVPGELSIINNVKKLPAANAMLFNYETKKINTWVYWKPPKYISKNQFSNFHQDNLAKEFEPLLEDSVRKQIHADVPVGILLSGGLDSSLITAMASKVKENINTFTVNFSGHKNYNESEYSSLIAKYFKTNHTEIDCGEISSDIMYLMARQFDEPLCDSSMLPAYLLTNKVKDYCKVVLGGDGGDELFGGYSYYNRLIYLNKIHKISPHVLRRVISKSISSLLPLGFKGKYLLQSIGMNLNESLPLIGSYFELNDRSDLLKDKSLISNLSKKKKYIEYEDLIQRATLEDFENFLVDDVLVKIDRASMLNSLEVRSPFLDKNIVDFSFGKIPSSLKVSKNERKIFLKRFAKKILPDNFNYDRKQGFSVPIGEWMKRGLWREMIHDILLRQESLFEKDYVLELIKGLDKGRNNGERLFSLLIFELWRIEYNVK